MEAKFTPGPWHARKCHVGFDICEENEHDVLTVFASSPEKVANAHLIAAAPEMYGALDQAYTALDGINTAEASAAREAIRSVRSKAEGRTV